MRVAAFPKCYVDEISSGRLPLLAWIEQATQLDVDGLELYEHFLLSTDPVYLDSVRGALDDRGLAMPMLCCSPDFTHPEPAARRAAIDREAELIRAARHLGGPGVACRVLSGQRHPGVGDDEGVGWAVSAITALLPLARELDVVLALENHYKDGYWTYPEFAQRPDLFHRILEEIDEREHFGVQFDPSNAITAGVDSTAFLRSVIDRVVTMQASDRSLEPGRTIEELRRADGTLGYSPNLRHGVVGQGLNDYDEIFRILVAHGYDGWISIEDGMNGMDEMAASIAFLRAKIAQYTR